MVDIFRDTTKSLPKKADPQIIRVSMEEQEIGGRKSNLPGQEKSGAMTVVAVPNAK
jgi:hypothetical protein